MLALVGSLLGLIFASYSTLDYSQHLDRRLHDIHCSFIPGAPAVSEAEACRAAMYSPYSAFFKQDYWGGIPISLLALGAFTFFAGFAVYLLLAKDTVPRGARAFYAVVGVTPFIVSVVMFTISVTKLGEVCKTCAGIYISSLLLAIGAVWGFTSSRPPAAPARKLGPIAPLVWLVALGSVTLLPALVYAASVPDESKYISGCGEIHKPPDDRDALLHLRTARSTQPALLFEDPLCPTCRAFHQRLLAEDVFDKLDVQLALFPLDNECNWMLDTALHPGACIVAKAVLCGGDDARKVLEWAYEDQPYLTRCGKAGEATLRAAIKEKWGANMLECIGRRDTDTRLNKHLHFATANSIPVSTPQMFLGKQRVCDEDTDIGLRYTLSRLAPEVMR